MKASKLQLAQIMKNAWAIAKIGSFKFGGSPRQYLSGALKMTHDMSKKGVVKEIIIEWTMFKNVIINLVLDINLPTSVKKAMDKSNADYCVLYAGTSHEKEYLLKNMIIDCDFANKFNDVTQVRRNQVFFNSLVF